MGFSTISRHHWCIYILAVFTFASCSLGQDPVRPYPLADQHLQPTSFLNHSSYIQDLDDHQWYLDNIPFVDFPDKSMQDVFYYRASVIKRHVKWTHEGHGFVMTEFIHPVAWASKFQTITDSAAYHILETRWLRNPNYAQDMVNHYMRGGVEKLSGITYTHFIQQAVLEHAQATGDVEMLKSQTDGMITTYNLWNVTRDNTTGLYHRTPLSDAQEYSLPGYLTGGPEGGPMQVWDDFGLSMQQGGGNDYATIWLGPETYRPNFNAYMVANARAISAVANLTGQTSLAQIWSEYADNLYSNMQDLLWSDDLQFWIDVVEGTNLACKGRELIGYFPYRFGVGTEEKYIRGLEVGLTNGAFIAEFGPTTLEQTNPYYTPFKNTTYCCMWQGQSWPFSTSVFLATLAGLARDGVSAVATAEFFNEALSTYVRTNYKEGVPYTAESHYPTVDEWSGDTSNHSEHYLHSTYMDNIFTQLIGINPTLENELQLHPLVPSHWTHFVIENLPYHGTLLTILWDKTGTHYSHSNSTSPGLSIYSNSTLIHTQPTLSSLNLTLPIPSLPTPNPPSSYQNILANPNAPHNLPNISTDYTLSTNGDYSPYEAWKMIDGLLWYDTVPQNSWTQNQSTVPYNTISIRLPRARNVSSVSLAIIDDLAEGGVITCPQAVKVTTKKGNQTVVLAERNPWTGCVGNALNTVIFSAPISSIANTTNTTSAPPLSQSQYGIDFETDNLAITLSDKQSHAFSVTEIQIWVPPQLGPRWDVRDGLLGTFTGGFEGRALGMNASIIMANDTADGTGEWDASGVQLGINGWVELAGIRTADSEGGRVNLTVVGGVLTPDATSGTASVSAAGEQVVIVQINWLTNHTITFATERGTRQELIVEVDLLRGSNVVTLFWGSGTPLLDSIVVGDVIG